MYHRFQRTALFLLIAVALPYAEKDILDQLDKTIRLKNRQIDSIRDELKRERNRINDLSKKEGTYLEQLQLLDKNIEVSQRYLNDLTLRIDSISKVIVVLQEAFSAASNNLKIQENAMGKRLRTLYKTGETTILQILLYANDLTDVIQRVKYFQKLNQYDQQLVHSIDSARHMVQRNQQLLKSQQDHLVSLKLHKEEEVLAFTQEQKKRKVLLEKVQDEKKSYLRMVNDLEAAQRSLDELLRQLEVKRRKTKAEQEKKPAVAFELLKGKLPWPLQGTVAKPYGKVVHPVYKTVTMNNGIDIETGKDWLVRCIARGVVEYIGSMRGYGKFVIINHFDGYLSVYAHLARIKVSLDQSVSANDGIGDVGAPGVNKKGNLHFQIRHTTETLDPLEWLKKGE